MPTTPHGFVYFKDEQERDQIKSQAAKLGLSFSGYIRQCLGLDQLQRAALTSETATAAGHIGGTARAKNLSAKERKRIAAMGGHAAAKVHRRAKRERKQTIAAFRKTFDEIANAKKPKP